MLKVGALESEHNPGPADSILLITCAIFPHSRSEVLGKNFTPELCPSY